MSLNISITRSLAILTALAAGFLIAGLEMRGAVRIRAGDLFLLLSAVLVIAAYLKGTEHNDLFPIMIALGAYTTYIFFNGLFLVNSGQAVKETLQLIFYILSFLALVLGLRKPDRFRDFAKLYFLLLWAVAIYSAGYHIIVWGQLSGWKDLGEQKLAYGLLTTLTLALVHPRFFKGQTMWILMGLALIMLFLSGERKGWIAAFAGCLAILMVAPHGRLSKGSLRKLVFFLFGIVLLVSLLAVVAPVFPYLNKQLGSLGDVILGLTGDNQVATTTSNRARLALLDFGVMMFLENPIFGEGLNQFKLEIANIPGNDVINEAHNELLRHAAELGSVGLGLYLLIYATALFRIFQIRSLGQAVGEEQFVKFRLGVGLLAYAFVVNLFLAGGGVSFFLIVLPLGLIYSVPLHGTSSAASELQNPGKRTLMMPQKFS